MNIILDKSTVEYIFKQASDAGEFWGLAIEAGLSINGGTESEQDEMLFAKLYVAKRRQANHRGIKLIKVGTNQWHIIETATEDALAFSTQYNLNKFEGFLKYLHCAEEIDTLSPRKLQFAGDDISLYYSIQERMKDDHFAMGLSNILFNYQKIWLNSYGLEVEVDTLYDYDNFLKAYELTREFNIQPAEFVKLMYEQWAWTKENLKSSQLCGDQARKILTSWKSNTLGNPQTNVQVKKIKLGKGADRYGNTDSD